MLAFSVKLALATLPFFLDHLKQYGYVRFWIGILNLSVDGRGWAREMHVFVFLDSHVKLNTGEVIKPANLPVPGG